MWLHVGEERIKIAAVSADWLSITSPFLDLGFLLVQSEPMLVVDSLTLPSWSQVSPVSSPLFCSPLSAVPLKTFQAVLSVSCNSFSNSIQDGFSLLSNALELCSSLEAVDKLM